MSIKSWKAIMVEVVEKERKRKAALAQLGRDQYKRKNKRKVMV